MLKFWCLKMLYSHQLCVGIPLFGGRAQRGSLKALYEKNNVVCYILILSSSWHLLSKSSQRNDGVKREIEVHDRPQFPSIQLFPPHVDFHLDSKVILHVIVQFQCKYSHLNIGVSSA